MLIFVEGGCSRAIRFPGQLLFILFGFPQVCGLVQRAQRVGETRLPLLDFGFFSSKRAMLFV